MSKKDNPAPPIVLRSVPADKPDLVVHAADLTVTARALAKLLAKQCENLFVHDRKPVLVLPDQDDGPPVMQSVSAAEVIIAAHKVCQPVKRKSSDRLEVTLPDKVAELYLAMPEEWGLRPLTSFASSPMLDEDGAIHCENGYDAATGVYLYKVPKLTLPDKPSREDAVSARATLRRAFRTFPFADRVAINETFSVDGAAIDVEVVNLEQPPGKDESALLVALLTAVCRPSLLIAPAIAFRGVQLSGSGVGKKLLFNSATMIAFGQRAPSAALGRKEEFEKGLVAALIRPDPCVTIDNINGQKLQSETLCTALTDRPALLRVLGASELKEANPRMLIGITGNAFTIAQDLIRRQFVIELDARVENPEQRKFAGNFLAEITAQRAELLQAALTIWRFGRQNAATLTRGQPLGGFEQWGMWARDPLLTLGCQDPVTEIAELKTSDPDRLATVEIFRAWSKHHGNYAVRTNDLNDAVKALVVPDSNKRSRQNVASRVAKLDGTRLAGFHLTSNKNDKNRGRWTAISYTLEGEASEAESEQATEAPAPAAARSSEQDDPDDWSFNREPDDLAVHPKPAAPAASPDAGGIAFVMTNVMKQQLRARGFSEERIIEMTPQEAHDVLDTPQCSEPPPPTDPVARWRAGFARLDRMRDPCAGFRTGEWRRIYHVGSTFLASPFAKLAVDAGWTELELVGVHPEVGVARPNACGALMTNAYGSPVTQVTPQLIRFANGLAVYKARLSVGDSVAVWDYREPAANECATAE